MLELADAMARAQAGGWDQWVVTESDRRAICEGCYFDKSAAMRVVRFAHKVVKHYKGRKFKGKPFKLIKWQFDRVIGPLFGWKQADGRRRFTRAFITMAKKNGKSGLASLIALFMLMLDGEPGAKVYCAANDKKQASIVWGDAAEMAIASPTIRSRVRILRGIHSIAFDKTASTLQGMSADVATAEGIDASCVIYDEMHMAKNRQMHEVLRFAGDGRDQPLFVMITTAGSNTQSICYEEYDLAKRVLEGTLIDIGLLPVIFEAGKDDDINDPKTWAKANPSLGITVDVEKFRQAVEEAKASPRKMNNLLRRKLNRWVSAPDGWIFPEKWAACAGKLPDLTGLPCWLGLDLGNISDLNALAELYKIGKKLIVRMHLWCPEETVKLREEEGKFPYAMWVKEGWITTMPGFATEHSMIEDKIKAIARERKIVELGYDPHQAVDLANRLDKYGVNCVQVPQFFTHLSPPTKRVETLVLKGDLVHDGSPVMAWMVQNVKLRFDGNKNCVPDKKHSAEKIDGASALVTGLSRAMLSDGPKKSVYESRGARWLG